MKNLTTISTDLFHKLRGTFTDIKIGDEEGRVTTDPANARFFDVNYSVKGNDVGRVNIKIDDDSLTVIYSDSMFDDAGMGKSQWYDFLKNLRQFAKRNMLRFDTRDITKSNLDQRDYQYLAQESGEKKMSESKLFGTSKTSYQDMGEAKIIVKHYAPVNYDNPAGRTQRIDSIYIENAGGERFRYPHKHLNGARAMARHVANGGTVYDDIGNYISGLSEELGKLKQFKNYSSRSGVVSETLNDLTQRVIQRMEQVKNEIRSLQSQTAYQDFSQSFKPQVSVEVPEDIRTKWVDELTIKSFNEELTSVFPYLYRLVNEKQTQELTYDDFVDEVVEGENGTAEVNHLAEFEKQLDDITTFDYELEEANDDEEPPFDVDDKQPSDRDEFGNVIKHRAKHLAKKGMKQVMPKEVVEFIASLYDRESGTFPKGEEGVKIAVEKKFGEQAGQFADFVVERLSAKTAQDMEEGWGSDEYHLFQNGYTVWQKKQTGKPGEPEFWLYKTPGIKSQEEAEQIVKTQEPVGKFPSLNMALDALKQGEGSMDQTTTNADLDDIKRLAGM
jgi:hypothetical protein